METIPGESLKKIPNKESVLSLEKIVEKYPQAIFVISGDIIPSAIQGREEEFRSPGYADVDYRDLITGGRARVIASAELARYFSSATLITTSYALGKEDRPTHASVMARELNELGVERDRIILEERSYNSLTELQEMVLLVHKNQWNSIAAVTSDYHIPRMRAMLGMLAELSEGQCDAERLRAISDALGYIGESDVAIQFVSAEDVLPIRSPHYAALLRKVRETAGYKLRLEAEQKGLRQLQDGTYKHA